MLAGIILCFFFLVSSVQGYFRRVVWWHDESLLIKMQFVIIQSWNLSLLSCHYYIHFFCPGKMPILFLRFHRFLLPCVCSVTDPKRRKNVVRTSGAHLAIASHANFLFLQHFDIICDLLLNSNMESVFVD